jgi:hypothetical protein
MLHVGFLRGIPCLPRGEGSVRIPAYRAGRYRTFVRPGSGGSAWIQAQAAATCAWRSRASSRVIGRFPQRVASA